jgi:hypothetical protein
MLLVLLFSSKDVCAYWTTQAFDYEDFLIISVTWTFTTQTAMWYITIILMNFIPG